MVYFENSLQYLNRTQTPHKALRINALYKYILNSSYHPNKTDKSNKHPNGTFVIFLMKLKIPTILKANNDNEGNKK